MPEPRPLVAIERESGISERNLLIRPGQHLFLDRPQAHHLRLELGELLLQPRGPGSERLRRRLSGSDLAVGGVELAQVARDALLDLRQPPLHFGSREVVVSGVDRLEFRAVNRDAGVRQQLHLPAQRNELRAHLLDGRAIVLAEIRNRLVIRREAPRQRHHFQIALAFPLQPPARLHAIEIAVDVELEQRRGMVGRPAGLGRIDAREPQIAEVERIHEHIDRANRIALVDEVIEAFGQQRRLLPIHPLHEARHQFPRDSAGDS